MGNQKSEIRNGTPQEHWEHCEILIDLQSINIMVAIYEYVTNLHLELLL
jgi:hypothetical protein